MENLAWHEVDAKVRVSNSALASLLGIAELDDEPNDAADREAILAPLPPMKKHFLDLVTHLGRAAQPEGQG